MLAEMGVSPEVSVLPVNILGGGGGGLITISQAGADTGGGVPLP